MTVREEKKMRRDLQAITVGTLIIVLALAVLLVGAGGAKWYVGAYVVFIGLGILLLVTGFIAPGKNDYGATPGEVRMVWGVLLAMGGVIGLVNEYVSSEWWVSVALILLTIGILILIMTKKGMIKR